MDSWPAREWRVSEPVGLYATVNTIKQRAQMTGSSTAVEIRVGAEANARLQMLLYLPTGTYNRTRCSTRGDRDGHCRLPTVEPIA